MGYRGEFITPKPNGSYAGAGQVGGGGVSRLTAPYLPNSGLPPQGLLRVAHAHRRTCKCSNLNVARPVGTRIYYAGVHLWLRYVDSQGHSVYEAIHIDVQFYAPKYWDFAEIHTWLLVDLVVCFGPVSTLRVSKTVIRITYIMVCITYINCK